MGWRIWTFGRVPVLGGNVATKSTNNTIWTVAIIAALAIVGYLLFWPKKKVSAATGSGATGSTTAYPGYSPYASTPQSSSAPKMPSLSFGGSSAQGGGVSAAAGSFSSWLSNVLNQGYQNAAALGNPEDSALENLNSTWTPEIENLSDLPSWSADDPNAPWNSVDQMDSDLGSWSADDPNAPWNSDAGDYGDYDYSQDLDSYSGAGGAPSWDTGDAGSGEEDDSE